MPTLVNVSGGVGGGHSSTLLATLSTIPTSYTAISGTENWSNYDAIYATVMIDSDSIYTITVYTSVVDKTHEYVVSDCRTSSYWGITYIKFSDTAISAFANHTNNITVTDLKIYGIKY